MKILITIGKIALAVLFLFLVIYIILLEITISVSSVPLIYLFFIAGPLLLAVDLWFITKRKWLRICFILVLVPLIVLPFVDVSPRKPFMRFYDSLQEGMSEAKIDELLAKNFPDSGRFNRPVAYGYGSDHIQFTLDPNDGRYNAELILLYMRNGRLGAKEYSGD